MERLNELKSILVHRCPNMVLLEQEPMSRHTSFRIGGPVALMALPQTVEDAVGAVQAAAEVGIVPFVLGNGSNLLVTDQNLDKFIIKTAGMLTDAAVEENVLSAQSGCTLSRLAVMAREHGLTGLEFAHGIPGSLGGAVTMNAGAYGGEMAQVVTQVTVLSPTGEIQLIEHPEFSYRHSCFSDGNDLILQARMQLQPGEAADIQARMDELMGKRKSKQPLEWASAGSTFKRPTGYFSAALIDQCGLKGFTVGGAQVSEKHAGFVINRGGATCVDVLSLMAQVRARVLQQTGVTLEPEVKLLGEKFPWNL